jgi:hypothetical protein
MWAFPDDTWVVKFFQDLGRWSISSRGNDERGVVPGRMNRNATLETSLLLR